MGNRLTLTSAGLRPGFGERHEALNPAGVTARPNLEDRKMVKIITSWNHADFARDGSDDYRAAGAYHADYFDADGLERARAAATKIEAEKILSETYRGRDDDGLGVDWEIA